MILVQHDAHVNACRKKSDLWSHFYGRSYTAAQVVLSILGVFMLPYWSADPMLAAQPNARPAIIGDKYVRWYQDSTGGIRMAQEQNGLSATGMAAKQNTRGVLSQNGKSCKINGHWTRVRGFLFSNYWTKQGEGVLITCDNSTEDYVTLGLAGHQNAILAFNWKQLGPVITHVTWYSAGDTYWSHKIMIMMPRVCWWYLYAKTRENCISLFYQSLFIISAWSVSSA